MREKNTNPPHVGRGWLLNGNPPGDLNKVLLCGAHARTTGQPCRQPAMKNGRCRLHGGKSTGPKTPEGKAMAKRGNWRHGYYSQKVVQTTNTIKISFRLRDWAEDQAKNETPHDSFSLPNPTLSSAAQSPAH